MKRCQAVVGFYLPQILTRPEIFPEPAGDTWLDLLRGPQAHHRCPLPAGEGRKSTGKIILSP